MSNPQADGLREVIRACWTEASKSAAPCCGQATEPAEDAEGQATGDRDPDEIRRAVREVYAKVSEGGTSCCADEAAQSCCAPDSAPSCSDQSKVSVEDVSARLGYSQEELEAVPEGANMGLGCGNPQAIAALKPGEAVVDLGSGGGFDCFLAARQVGDEGQVIGVDMTPEMVSKARANAEKGGYGNVDFRLGEIEHLPVADASVDVVISNCVINLSPDKPAVYGDAFRVLKPGGRIAVSDVVRTTEAEFPEEIRNDLALVGGCVAGAASVGELETVLREAGFEEIRIDPQPGSREFIQEWAPGRGIEDHIASATIEAVRPVSLTRPRPEPIIRPKGDETDSTA